MTAMTRTERCRMMESSLPVAPYRATLTALHDEMLAEIESLQQDVKKFREAASCERDVRQQLERVIEAAHAVGIRQEQMLMDDEALLRQALEALKADYPADGSTLHDAAIADIHARLERKE